jgi:hypothetical protein
MVDSAQDDHSNEAKFTRKTSLRYAGRLASAK